MAFEREENLTKDSIQDFEIKLFVPGPLNTEDPQAGKIEVQILKSDDNILVKSYDLLLRLQDDAEGVVHLSNLADLRDYVKIRLDAEVLPVP